MQEASGPPYQVASLGMKPRFRGQSPRCKFSFKFWGAASLFVTCSGPILSLKSRREAIRVVRVVVVAAAARVDIAEVVRVAGVHRAKPPVAGRAVRICPKVFLSLFSLLRFLAVAVPPLFVALYHATDFLEGGISRRCPALEYPVVVRAALKKVVPIVHQFIAERDFS